MTTFEFWPDYGAGPLWNDGQAVELLSLGLPDELVLQLQAWNDHYTEDKLPLEGAGDPEWLREGATLLHSTRAALGPSISIVVTEPWWRDEPTQE